MKKNILILIGNMCNGGAERVVYNLCNNLKDEYNITLVVRTMKDADYIPDVNIIEIPNLGNRKKLLLGLIELKRLKKKLKIDTSISFLTKYNAYNYLTKGNDKVILSVRNVVTEMTKKNSKILNHFYGLALRKADLVVNVSEAAKKDSVEKYCFPKEKNIVIPNFCDLDNIEKLKCEAISAKDKKIYSGKTVISFGRYNDQKGQWHAIRAFKKVVEYDKDIKLVLAGRGDLKEYFLKLVEDLHLEKNVFVTDFIQNVYPYMSRAKVYLLNSFHEGMPNVLLEAMALGLPVIASDAPGGSKEILDPKNVHNDYVDKLTKGEYGILIPVCDRTKYGADDPLTKEEQMIADAIIMLFKDTKLYDNYKKASKKRIKDFSKENILNMWKEII